jgi:TIR domain/Kelch motif
VAESAAPSLGRIFISYRREETAYPAGWLYDRLANRYGVSQIFKDVDSIELGDNFVEVITRAVGACDVLLALVGNQWLTTTDARGRRRLDDPDDFVRLEIETALTRNIRVIPILVDGATMPPAEELPPSLASLMHRQALELSPARFEYDTSRLLRVLDRTLAEVRTAYDAAPIGKVPAPGTAEPRTSPERQEQGEPSPIPRITPLLSPPAAPAGLSGSSADGRVDLRWDPPVAGAVDVVGWEVRRDGIRVGEVTDPRASDEPPGPGSYTYTVVAAAADGQRSIESSAWVRPGRRPRWLVPALAILAAVLATAGLLLWAPWSPPAWQKLENTGFQETFSAAGVAEHNGELWVVGGQDGGKRSEVRVFDPQTGEWRDGPKLPEGISHAPLVSTGDKLYLLGGLTAIEGDDNVPLDTVYRLDSEDPDGWKEDVTLPARRFSGAAAWDGQRLVFAGGADQIGKGQSRPAKADIWQLRSGKWDSIGSSELQPARERPAAATNGRGTIWFVGGADHGPPRQMFDDVDVLTGNEVNDGTAIRTKVQGAAAIWTPETGPCVLGGSTDLPNQHAKPVADVECLGGTEPDPNWPDLPEARYNAGAAVIDHTVYVVGGGSEPADMVLALRFG